MSEDRELLELAAKAAGMKNHEFNGYGMQELAVHGVSHCGFQGSIWNPLTDDGDALRLAVKLGLNVIQQRTFKGSEPVAAAAGFGVEDYQLTSTDFGDGPYAATRRAIVRAAAEIGKAMPITPTNTEGEQG